MVLVDTSVWVSYLRDGSGELGNLLDEGVIVLDHGAGWPLAAVFSAVPAAGEAGDRAGTRSLSGR